MPEKFESNTENMPKLESLHVFQEAIGKKLNQLAESFSNQSLGMEFYSNDIDAVSRLVHLALTFGRGNKNIEIKKEWIQDFRSEVEGITVDDDLRRAFRDLTGEDL
ncbi:MAG: hypothetical protein A3G59_02580 [Candidatus Taylorbacteria bacterium RIFCSPLOWO2_12_FULL_47_20]|uniref:Uncharacterized protein n=2 Tax=Candidatus Tayloriibacteriota TaxID=1817919 RepID=A0A1G2P7F2_9BACT|nr:MAG: hypothetical protein A3H68_01420 [Candidatus Taylorbacteria bacterium RIFCSPLOWO2_02_FULL_46_40]OHA44285.1 MAG: hypothetical protein A3G59_02580 [Candidatus Taylorbacteria bacterium RIFCSPLOWO2_12_FULL_47_20]